MELVTPLTVHAPASEAVQGVRLYVRTLAVETVRDVVVDVVKSVGKYALAALAAVVAAVAIAKAHVQEIAKANAGLPVQAVVPEAVRVAAELPAQIIALGVQAVALPVQKVVPGVQAVAPPVQIIALGVQVAVAAVLRVLVVAPGVQAVALHAQTTVPAVVPEAVITAAPVNVRAVRATAQALVPQSV